MEQSTEKNECRVTVVIPTFNKVELTLPCLETLTEYTEESIYDVVIVDNASVDETRTLLNSLEGDVQTVLNETNLGFGPACNQGAAKASAEFICFLNNDVLVTPKWLEPLILAMDQDPKLAAVQSRMLYPDGRLNSAGDLVFAEQCWNYGKGALNPNALQYASRRAVDYASGACLLVRREMFNAVGGFDDAYAPAYYEDADLSFLFRSRGWKVIYEPRSTVYHIEGGTSESALPNDFKTRQMAKNKEYFWKKWEQEIQGRPLAMSLEVVEEWAHRDFGEFAPLPYDA